ncbi:hypothetical protein [Micromonospora radicis]|uniref:hypothetical protein n=1 Tax=Micromonospora radicis TaxID=1894971 RepID=UPI0011C3C542|nr:hypothetical protein [Micromonospora radicis]
MTSPDITPADSRQHAVAVGGVLPTYQFLPVLPQRAGTAIPPVVDLTVAHSWSGATDEADDAAVAAVMAVAGSVALWRAWRRYRTVDDVVRVYVVEVDRVAGSLPAVGTAMQSALAGVAVLDSQVEVYGTGDELPAYQRQARGASALLWTAVPTEPVRIARVFDRVDPVTGPAFDPAHPHLDAPEILAYLDAGAALLATTQRMVDVLDPTRGPVVPMSYRTDGQWIWTDTVSYYLREHRLAPDAELLEHIREHGSRPPAVTAVGLHRAQAALFAPADVAPAWTAA